MICIKQEEGALVSDYLILVRRNMDNLLLGNYILKNICLKLKNMWVSVWVSEWMSERASVCVWTINVGTEKAWKTCKSCFSYLLSWLKKKKI